MNKELYEFMVWLAQKMDGDCEDIYERQFSSYECRQIYQSLINGLNNDMIETMLRGNR